MAWDVIRTEPIIVRLHCSLTQYLNGPGKPRLCFVCLSDTFLGRPGCVVYDELSPPTNGESGTSVPNYIHGKKVLDSKGLFNLAEGDVAVINGWMLMLPKFNY